MVSSSIVRPVAQQFGEHAAAADGLELVRVTDQDEPPVGVVGELGQAVEVAGGEHAGLVDDHGGAGGRGATVGREVGRSGPFVEEFGDGVASSSRSRLRSFRAPSRSVRARTRHGPGPAEVVDRGFEHGGLAGPGRSDDQHEPVLPGDGCGGVDLHHVERPRLIVTDGCGVELVVDRPGQDVFFLGENLSLVRCVPTVRSTPTAHPRPGVGCADRSGRDRHSRRAPRRRRVPAPPPTAAPSTPGSGRASVTERASRRGDATSTADPTARRSPPHSTAAPRRGRACRCLVDACDERRRE